MREEYKLTMARETNLSVGDLMEVKDLVNTRWGTREKARLVQVTEANGTELTVRRVGFWKRTWWWTATLFVNLFLRAQSWYYSFL